jgi:hypothetical protein
MSLDLGYTIQGRGGSALFWMDNAGNVPWSAIANYNFNLLPGATDDWRSSTSGSFLLSTPFSLAATQRLIIIASVTTAHREPFFDVGFALLLTGTQIQEILFAIRPDGITHRGDMGPPPAINFAPPSANVTLSKVTTGPANVVLDGITYGPPNNPGDCGGTSCTTEVTSSCVPGGGSYQLLFGMFVIEGPPNVGRPAAMIVKFVNAQ